LYDLMQDPLEFNDLSGDQAFTEELDRLKEVLIDWQESTLDPLHNPEILARVTHEMDSVNRAYPDRNYSKNPDFKWDYPEYFYEFILANR